MPDFTEILMLEELLNVGALSEIFEYQNEEENTEAFEKQEHPAAAAEGYAGLEKTPVSKYYGEYKNAGYTLNMFSDNAENILNGIYNAYEERNVSDINIDVAQYMEKAGQELSKEKNNESENLFESLNLDGTWNILSKNENEEEKLTQNYENSAVENENISNVYSQSRYGGNSKSVNDTNNYSTQNSDFSSKNKNISIVLNNYSNIYSQTDEEKLINSLAARITEYVAYGGEGAHI